MTHIRIKPGEFSLNEGVLYLSQGNHNATVRIEAIEAMVFDFTTDELTLLVGSVPFVIERDEGVMELAGGLPYALEEALLRHMRRGG